jgi:uncharacterized protein with NRDE domain
MCTLAVAVGGSSSRWPLVVAANRDEMLARPARPPFLWPGEPRVIAPRDEVAGGTWLGLNERALFVGVTNRAGRAPDRSRRSRGALVAEALRAPSAAELHARLAALDPTQYNGFHLVYADRASAHLTWSDGEALHRSELAPGLHVVTERSFGAGDARRADLVRDLWPADGDSAALASMLGRHAEDPFAATCVHADAFGYGTRSSMVLHLGRTWDDTSFLWAEGRPCVTPFADQQALLDGLAAQSSED